MDNYISYLKDSGKSDKTISIYKKSLSDLFDYFGKESDELDFLLEYEVIVQYLDMFTFPLRKLKTTAIVSVFDYLFDEDDILEKYLKYKKNIIKQYKPKIKHNITKKQIIECLDVLHREIYKKHIHKLKDFTFEQSNLLRKYLIICLFTLTEPKLGKDYCDMKIVESDDDTTKKGNYFVKEGFYFMFDNIKTLIPKKLKTVIKLWLKYNDTDYFLINSKKQTISYNLIVQYIRNFFKSVSPNVGIYTLRRVYKSI